MAGNDRAQRSSHVPSGYLADLAILSNDHLFSEMIANTDHEQRSWWEERMFASEPARRFEPVSDTYVNRMFADLWQTAEETAALSVEGALKFEQKQAALHLLRSRERTFCLLGMLHLHSGSTVIKQLHCQMHSEVQRQCQKSNCGYSWLLVS